MTKTVTGSFKFGNGQPVANGTVYMKLVQDATVAATGQIAPAVVSFVLDSNGTLGSGVTMFASDELTPTNIAYALTVTTQGGGQVYGPEFFVISGTSPISLNNLLPSANSPVVFSTAVLTNPTAEQAVTGFPLSLIALDLPEAAAPANPPASTVRVYSKAGDGLYYRNSAGTETGPVGAAVTLQTNGTNNSSQSSLNLITSTANTAGLTATPSNPSAGNEKIEISGTLAHASLPALLSGDIPNNAANTTGKSAATDALNSATTVVNVAAATAPSAGQILTATSSTAATWQARVAAISYVIDGAGSVPATGAKGQVSIPTACTITGWVLTADQSGSAVVDVLRSTYAGFPTTSSIASTDKPTLSSVQKNENLAVSVWTTAISAGDQIQFNLNSVTTCTRLNLTINVTIP